MMNRLKQKWVVDECPDANGNWTIRVTDGTRNGNIEMDPIATVYGLALAERIVHTHNQERDNEELSA